MATPQINEYPMGEAGRDALRLGFDRTVKLVFQSATVSSDAGLFPYRDLDDVVRLTESVAADLLDFGTGRNIQHSMTALLRQSIYSRLAGYENVNGADRPGVDPVMRQIVSSRAITRSAVSPSLVGRFKTEVLAHPDNLAKLRAMPGASDIFSSRSRQSELPGHLDRSCRMRRETLPRRSRPQASRLAYRVTGQSVYWRKRSADGAGRRCNGKCPPKKN